jgi:hypothetical protein
MAPQFQRRHSVVHSPRAQAGLKGVSSIGSTMRGPHDIPGLCKQFELLTKIGQQTLAKDFSERPCRAGANCKRMLPSTGFT